MAKEQIEKRMRTENQAEANALMDGAKAGAQALKAENQAENHASQDSQATADNEQASAPEQAQSVEPAGPGIYRALAKVTASIGVVAKNKQVNALGNGPRYNFRGIDDVYNAVNKAFGENGIFCLPRVLARTEEIVQAGQKQARLVTLRVRYLFCHADGSSISCEVIGEAQDSSDKGTAKAMSIAHKYAILQMFCVPTDDMAEQDQEKVDITVSEKRPAARPACKGAKPRDLTDLESRFIKYMNKRQGYNQGAIKRELSSFFQRSINSVQDLTEDEINEFWEACEMEYAE